MYLAERAVSPAVIPARFSHIVNGTHVGWFTGAMPLCASLPGRTKHEATGFTSQAVKRSVLQSILSLGSLKIFVIVTIWHLITNAMTDRLSA